MNILMALSQLEVTGAEVYATTIGNELSRRGHAIFYVSDTLTKPVTGRFIPLTFNKRSLPRRLWHVAKLIYLIKKHQIQLVHAHSRASGWSCYVACKITNTPMVTTVHGRQPVHASRKAFHALGYRAIAVCEDIRDQIISALGVAPNKVSVLPNAVDPALFVQHARPHQSALAAPEQTSENRKFLVSIIGRLSGPKGDLCFRLLDEILSKTELKNRAEVQIITGSAIPERFEKFKSWVSFPGYTDNVAKIMANSDLVIGAGRVAVESLMVGTPVFAIGEAKSIGLVTKDNLELAMASNFGDVGPQELDIDFRQVGNQIAAFINNPIAPDLRHLAVKYYGLAQVVGQLEFIYQDAVVETLQREMPILMYHRFIGDPAEKGVHGTWITVEMFEKHLQLIKRLGFETLTFKDLAQKGFIHRLTPGKKFLMITADDGYRDNLTRMLPLLEKYDMKATVYVVSNETHNRWDTEHPTNPDTKVPLLTADEIRALDASGRVEIGGHTLSHAKLDELPEAEQCKEIVENKRVLEEILGHPILSFAYPFGNLNDSAKRQVMAAGYQFAVATDSGPRAMHQDAFQIRRINVFPRTTVFGLWRKIRGNYVWRR
ncbi:polysaccharide deacetylase family protein [beta proteobacterium MWH-UniP1]